MNIDNPDQETYWIAYDRVEAGTTIVKQYAYGIVFPNQYMETSKENLISNTNLQTVLDEAAIVDIILDESHFAKVEILDDEGESI